MTDRVFNLIDEPWLPVRRRSGAIEHIPPWRINDRIHDDPFVAFAWPRPDFNGAAHEFLIGLLATATAPDNNDEWEDSWQNPPTPDALEKSFSRFAHAFALDGPGARFLQDLDPLDDADSKEVAALLIDCPGAQTLRNNADLFVKRGMAPVLSRAAAAMAIFTLNSYAPSGGAGHRTSLRGGGPMTTLILADHPRYGNTLWSRIWPNVESCKQIVMRWPDAKLEDDDQSIFPWLVPTRTSNPKAGGTSTSPMDVHPLQVYWGMPRRIRLQFEETKGRRCSLTSTEDAIVVTNYRTRNYGTNYTEGFSHPLTPYYRTKPGGTLLPVHPKPGGISYRLWPGLVVSSKDGLREPAQSIREWQSQRRLARRETRFAAFGYDMDNMKARAWMEGEMPLWNSESEAQEWLEGFIQRATAGADNVARLIATAVKSARYDRPGDAKGDYDFIAERFYRDSEAHFHEALKEAVSAVENDPDCDDPTADVCGTWARSMRQVALRLFDEYAPAEGLEERAMHRHVKAHFFLNQALRGYGKVGKSLFGDLGIMSPDAKGSKQQGKEAA